MSIRSFKTSSIRTGEKRSKFWDQSTVIINGAYESIASATGTGSSGTITFSNIPADYQHLQIRGIARTSANFIGSSVYIRFNSDSGSNYTEHLLRGNGSSVIATGSANISYGRGIWAISGNSASSNILGVGIIDIHDYASTTKFKTLKVFSGCDYNTTDGKVDLHSTLWRSTNAITSITLLLDDGGNFTTQTQFALYGIRGA